MIEAVRTPDERFRDLPDWPYEPQYLEDLPGLVGLRMHYVDVGPADATTVFLCLHGQPTWSYLYRKMIPVFVEAGARVIAPDFYGFGRSDKPVEDTVYTFDFHRGALLAFTERLGLHGVTLVCQDWGGLLGLTLPLDQPGLIGRLIVMNTAIAAGQGVPSPGFEAWPSWSASQGDMNVGKLMRRAVPDLSDEEVAAYDAPFEDARAKAGVRRFPAIVPTEPDMPGAELGQRTLSFWRESWRGPTFMAIGMQDPVLGPDVMNDLCHTIHGCSDPLELPDAGHFVQESGDIVARAALRHFDGR